MKILAVDTSSNVASVAIVDDKKLVCECVAAVVVAQYLPQLGIGTIGCGCGNFLAAGFRGKGVAAIGELNKIPLRVVDVLRKAGNPCCDQQKQKVNFLCHSVYILNYCYRIRNIS